MAEPYHAGAQPAACFRIFWTPCTRAMPSTTAGAMHFSAAKWSRNGTGSAKSGLESGFG